MPFLRALQKAGLGEFVLPSLHWYTTLTLSAMTQSLLCLLLGPYYDLASPHLPATHLLRCTGSSAPLPCPPINIATSKWLHNPKLCPDFKSCKPKHNFFPLLAPKNLPSLSRLFLWVLKTSGFSQSSSPAQSVILYPAGTPSTDSSISRTTYNDLIFPVPHSDKSLLVPPTNTHSWWLLPVPLLPISVKYHSIKLPCFPRLHPL